MKSTDLAIVTLLLSMLRPGLLAAAGTQEVYDGFEGPELSKIWRTDKLAKGALVLQSEHVRTGRGAAMITLRANDPSPKISAGDTERDELQEIDKLNVPEKESWHYEFSILLPVDFPVVDRRLVLAQWKQKTGHAPVTVDNPVIAVRYVAGVLTITLQTSEDRTTLFQTHEEVRGHWLDFVFHIRHTSNADGSIRVWLNKKEVVSFMGATAYSEKIGYPANATFYFKMGLYRDDMPEPWTAYYDEYRKRPLTETELL